VEVVGVGEFGWLAGFWGASTAGGEAFGVKTFL